MKFITDDNMEFTTYEEAVAYEKCLASKGALKKCIEDIKEGLKNKTLFVVELQECGSDKVCPVIIHNPDGVDNELINAIIYSNFGEPSVFLPDSFTVNPVYKICPIKASNTKAIECIAQSLVDDLKDVTETESYIELNGIVIFSKDKKTLSSKLKHEANAVFNHNDFLDLVSYMLGL